MTAEGIAPHAGPDGSIGHMPMLKKEQPAHAQTDVEEDEKKSKAAEAL